MKTKTLVSLPITVDGTTVKVNAQFNQYNGHDPYISFGSSSKILKALILARGFKSSEVSISSDSFAGGCSITVHIKKPDIDFNQAVSALKLVELFQYGHYNSQEEYYDYDEKVSIEYEGKKYGLGAKWTNLYVNGHGFSYPDRITAKQWEEYFTP